MEAGNGKQILSDRRVKGVIIRNRTINCSFNNWWILEILSKIL